MRLTPRAWNIIIFLVWLAVFIPVFHAAHCSAATPC